MPLCEENEAHETKSRVCGSGSCLVVLVFFRMAVCGLFSCSFHESLKSTNMAVKNLSAKVNTIEQSISFFSQLSDDVGLPRSSGVAFETNVARLTSPLEDFESRSRRNNFIFYGFADTESESWAISDKSSYMRARSTFISLWLRLKLRGRIALDVFRWRKSVPSSLDLLITS